MSFKWFQNNSTVTISFAVAPTVKKQEVDVHITNSAIRAGAKGSPAVCEGQLCSAIKSSKWALKSNMVVIHLDKVTKGKWPSLFVGAPQKDTKAQVRVIYDYDATDPIELTIREGEVISVLHQDPSGWWKGEINGKVGLFPHNFVEPITADNVEPPEDMTESASAQEEEAQEVPVQSLPQFQPPNTTPISPVQLPMPVQPPQPQSQPTQPQTQANASTGADETRPRMPAMAGALSMDELKNKLKKRAGGDEVSPGSSTAPSASGSRLFNRTPSDTTTSEPTSAGSKIFGRSAEPATGDTPTGSRVFRPPLSSSTDTTPTTGSRFFNRTAATPAISSTGEQPTSAETSAIPAPPTAGVSRLKFGNKGSSLALGAIAAGVIASNAERQPAKESSTSNVVLPPPPEPIVDTVVTTPKPPGACVRAVYEYEAVDEGEIGFAEGTEIEVLVRDGSGWWQGKLPTGQVGWFPANFVEEISLPPPVLPEETLEEKLAKVSSTAARLATPKRAAGSSNRRKPTKQNKKATDNPVSSTPEVSKVPRPLSRVITPLNSSVITPAPVPNPPTEEPKTKPKPAPRRNVPAPQEPTADQQNSLSTASPPPSLNPSTSISVSTITPIPAPATSTQSPNPTPKAPVPVARKLAPKAAARPLTTIIPRADIIEERSIAIEKPLKPSASKERIAKWPVHLGTFTEFCSEMTLLCSNNKGTSIGLCTIDGATFSAGETSFQVLQNAAFPFVYAFAARELGRTDLQKLVTFEPLIADVSGIPPGQPKALSKAGILVVLGALLSRGVWGNDGRSRVERLLDLFGQAAGGLRVQSSLSTFLSLRDSSHQDYALAHGLKACGQLPSTANVGEVLDLYFAASSIESDLQCGAALAALFAAEGVSPLNNQKVLEPPMARAVLELILPITPELTSVMSVAVPGTSTILLFIPKVLGVALHASSYQQAQEIAKTIAQKLHS